MLEKRSVRSFGESLRVLSCAALTLLACQLIGCKEDDGSFSVVFRWEGGEPDDDVELFVVARVEEAFESGEGRTLASAGPELYAPNMRLPLDDVPNGTDRRVVVEVRESAGGAAQILYYGISEPFDVVAGKDTVVEVRLQLTHTPGASEGVGVSIANTPSPGIAASTDVTLRVVSDSAVSVQISNRAGFPMGSQTFELEDAELADEQPDDEELTAHELEWDLDESLDEPCGEVDFCDRRVFVRFEDAEGYLSSVFSAAITVDSKPPGVVEDSVAIRLDPAVDNPLVLEKRADLITAVTTGTKVTLVFALDEQVMGTPTVRAIDADGDVEPLVFEYADRSSYVFQHAYTGTDPIDSVDFEIEVTATDKAGTEATLPLGAFVVDTVPPDAPAQPSDEPTLIYERRPWGSDATGALSFAVRANPGSVTPGSSVFFYDGSDIETAQRLGFLDQADDEGGFDATSLARADAPQVYARVVDSAGNGAASATLVRDVEWTASLAGHVVGQPGNPNSFESRRWTLDALQQADGQQSDGDPLAERDEPVTVSGAGRWQRVVPATAPSARYWPGMAYDAARGRVVMFGGSNALPGASPCDEAGLTVCAGPTEWDGYTWRARSVEGETPTPIDSPRATWDGTRGLTLFFGGKGAFGGCGRDSSFCAQLWAYDGDRFRLLDGGGDGTDRPQGRSNHIMVYDSRRDRVVLYGGNADVESESCKDSEIGITCRDTWEWDGERWEQAVAASPPGYRRFAAAAFDETLGKVVMYGGETPSSPPWPETWTYDGDTWEQVTAPSSAPQQPLGRLDGSLTYSRKLGRIVMFGGQANDAGSCDGGPAFDYYCAALWSFNGSFWERIEEPEPKLPAPVGRSRAGLAEDAFGNLLLFGGDRMLLGPTGDCTSAICPGVWVWEGEHWRQRTATSPPLALRSRFNHSAGYDPSSGNAYMFGGRVIEAAQMCPGDLAQSNTLGNSILYMHDLWRWDGNAWAQVTTSGIESGTREGAAMASLEDAAPVLVGGSAWPYEALTPTPASGADRVCGGLLPDEAQRGLYSEGSWTIEGDVLTDPGASLALAGTPEVRGEAAIAGAGDDSFVMFGGTRECSELGDTWRYDEDNGWQSIAGGDGPDARRSAALAYDRGRDELVLFGGGHVFADDPGAQGELADAAGCTRCRCADEGTFVLNGAAWSSADSTDEPPPRWNAAMAYVDDRESVLLMGGTAPADCGTGTAKCGDTWEWDGQAWHRVEPADPEGDGDPAPREEHAMVEDRARHELLMTGGTFNARDFTWLWHSGAQARPAQLAHFAFGSTGAPADVEIRDLALDWEASADSSAGDELTVQVWNRGKLTPVDELGFERDGDRWSLEDSETLSALPYGPEREIAFAIEPAADNGTYAGYSSLETRFVELLVSYRLPPAP